MGFLIQDAPPPEFVREEGLLLTEKGYIKGTLPLFASTLARNGARDQV